MAPRWVILSAAVLAVSGCASSQVDLVPIPPADGALSFTPEGTAKLQLRVQNQGRTPATSSPVAIEFFLRSFSATTAIQDGGRIEPGQASGVLTFDVPEGCVEGGCTFEIRVDPKKTVRDANRGNNLARGRCEGETAAKFTPNLEKLHP
jgi:hypothetical protein